MLSPFGRPPATDDPIREEGNGGDGGNRGRAAGFVALEMLAWPACGWFFPALVMGILKDVTGSQALGFMLLSEFALVCLIVNVLVLQ